MIDENILEVEAVDFSKDQAFTKENFEFFAENDESENEESDVETFFFIS